MALEKLKENATPDEINEWYLRNNAKYEQLENDIKQYKDIATKTDERIKQLEERNQQLFLRVTEDIKGKGGEENDGEEIIPECVEKEMYEKFDKSMKKELKELIEEWEE